jgi:large subunit ribosomal protein L21
MYAVIRSGGKQYRVAPGETIQVEKLDGKVGSKVTFDDIVAVRTDKNEIFGGDKASKAKISGKIVSHGRQAKRIVLKFKRCGQYKITRGHRQDFTAVQVGDIQFE